MAATAPPQRTDRRGLVAWALWDWGSAAFNAVVTTFVFSTYLASRAFVDPALVAHEHGAAGRRAVEAALAHNATVVSVALTIAGVVVALIAPAIGRFADASGHRKRSVLLATIGIVLSIGCMVFVAPAQPYLVLGASLLGIGTVAYEIASVGYNAMLGQVAPEGRTGRVSGIGWAAGYFGGIVLLVVLLVLCIQDFGSPDRAGLLGLPSTVAGGEWSVRVAIGIAALWLAASSVPLFVVVPEATRGPARRSGVLTAYADLGRDVARLWRERRDLLMFLVASAVFRDGLAAVFTFGAIIAAQVFGFSSSEVILFAIAANVVAGIATVVSGRLDDRFGSRALILAALVGLVACGTGVLFIGTAQQGFWVLGLALCLFVGPVQSSSRAYLARLATPGREGELFGLYATTGRAASFLAPALFGLAVTIGGSTRFGILGIVAVLLAGLVLMLFVRVQRAQPASLGRA
ncbi:MFS transporter [Curtobacterium sp. MCBD17_035]|uniref:MFS transporter n=1 Tax=Curtobacterium sp. MCBD17_035 TaxID=2175673 RepID=UPI000DAA8F47|nr:MFS transporter [Curtobacterium sp. MCBD17_035]WIB66813.1 MFS transporter [Curtobacterium sp. MCBD17_035]